MNQKCGRQLAKPLTMTWSTFQSRCVPWSSWHFAAGAHLSQDDLVVVRSAVTSYGPIIFGKIRIRAIKLDSSGEVVPGEVKKDAHGKIEVQMKHGKIDDDGLGFIFVRCVRLLLVFVSPLTSLGRIHDPPGDVGVFHDTFRLVADSVPGYRKHQIPFVVYLRGKGCGRGEQRCLSCHPNELDALRILQ
jgi:hypothetical protein